MVYTEGVLKFVGTMLILRNLWNVCHYWQIDSL